MSLDLFRIDERLLHGQVIVGWGMRLHIDYYVIVDDEVARTHGKRICTPPDCRPGSTLTSCQ